MAITLTIADFMAALRLTDTPEETAEATRLLAVATELVTRHLGATFGSTPDAVANEAVIRIGAYFYDQPFASRGDSFGNAIRNSGAGSFLLPYLVHRAGLAGDAAMAAAQEAVGSVGNPVTGLAIVGGDLVVTFADGNTVSLTLPVGGGSGDGTDQTARDSAQDAQDDIDTHGASTHNTDGEAREASQRANDKVDEHVANHPSGGNVDQTARNAAASALSRADTAQTEIDTHEATTHNTDTTARTSAEDNADNLTAHELTPHGGSGDDAYGWATEGNTEAIPADKLTNAPGGGDDAYDWATVGNDALLVPTDKVNLAGVQSQIDEIVDEIAHSEGEIIAVVPTVGAGMDTLRYTLPNNLNGLYDVSVRVSARVQVNEFANISGNLHIIEDGGLGLNAAIPPKTHNYHHAHDGVVNFFRKGLAIAPGANHIDFTALVTGQNPPDVHFNTLENMTITNTSLVNSSNVNPFISDWAETDNTDDIPSGKLGNVKGWARLNVSPVSFPFAQELGGFALADIAAIPNGGEQQFLYHCIVQRDIDATLAYLGGSWTKEVAGSGGGGLPLALQALSTGALALTSTPVLIPGMLLPASTFTAGDTWRVTATCYFAGIGDAAHDVSVRILQGTTVEAFGLDARFDGDSASKFEVTVDRIITIANPPAAIEIHADENSGNVLTQASTLIAMQVRTS